MKNKVSHINMRKKNAIEAIDGTKGNMIAVVMINVPMARLNDTAFNKSPSGSTIAPPANVISKQIPPRIIPKLPIMNFVKR